MVDDEPDIRELLRLNLEAGGYEVTTAADGDEALAAVVDAVPDAILLDVLMPGTDGWAVLERLKSGADAVSGVPVLMLTALAEPEQRLRGGIEGAVRYVTKPFDPRALLRALAEVLDPAGPSEMQQRTVARQHALEALARLEARGADALDAVVAAEPRVHLTRLENTPVKPLPPLQLTNARSRVGSLTVKQRDLLTLLERTRSVAVAADELGTSRSNVYASLRRIVHRLGLRDTSELLRLLARGELLESTRGA